MVEWPELGRGAPIGSLRSLLDPRPTWQEQAPCSGRSDVMFGPDETAAKALCAGCPVLTACLRLALDTESVGGVWGGMNHEERLRTCPVCLGPKDRGDLACGFAHKLARTARLVELQEVDPDVRVPRRQDPSARTSELCPLPRGHNHGSARSYRRGCRCDESKDALRRERLTRGTHAAERGPYRKAAADG